MQLASRRGHHADRVAGVRRDPGRKEEYSEQSGRPCGGELVVEMFAFTVGHSAAMML